MQVILNFSTTYIFSRNQVTSNKNQENDLEEEPNDINANTTNESKLNNTIVGLVHM